MQDRPAIFLIPFDHIIPCEMHALMRVSDRLEWGLIRMIEGCYPLVDERDDKMAAFVAAVNTCIPGVHFKIWMAADGPGENAKMTQHWTDLTAYQKRRLLVELPDQ